MKEWLAAFLTMALLDRRKKENQCPPKVDRRRMTPKKAQMVLRESIERLDKALTKIGQK